jgi:hypothetical protein
LSHITKHPWFTFHHRKKTDNHCLLLIEMISTIFLLQKERKSSTAKKIFDIRTKMSLNKNSHKETQIKGVAEQ